METGACPHTAIRDDVTANLIAVEDLERDFAPLDVVLVESGGDNLTATFSPALVDAQIFVLDVAGGGDVARKGGPGIERADLLVVNKTDLGARAGEGPCGWPTRPSRPVAAGGRLAHPHPPRVGGGGVDARGPEADARARRGPPAGAAPGPAAPPGNEHEVGGATCGRAGGQPGGDGAGRAREEAGGAAGRGPRDGLGAGGRRTRAGDRRAGRHGRLRDARAGRPGGTWRRGRGGRSLVWHGEPFVVAEAPTSCGT